MIRRVRGLLSIAIAVLLPTAAQAQQVGNVTGRVTGANGQPLTDTRVQIVGTTRGTMTFPDGRYRITLVPTGTVQVRAIRLGYTAQTKQVVVAANADVDVNFTLNEAVTSLDQVVVTATGETQRKRESGVSVGTIDTSAWNAAAVPTMSSVLTARTPGVLVQTNGGTTGASTRVRIRGSNSINLSNDPLIIVDGTRANNNAGSFSIGVGGQSISRLEDFNPEELESVDIIKGPAAAALYGTAAANGVIQITTKKGRSGKTRWNAYEEYGTVKDNYEYPDNWSRVGTNAAGTSILNCTLEREVIAQYGGSGCAPKADSMLKWNPIENVSPFINGWRQEHGLNINGGTEATTYFLSGEYEREQGVYDINKLKKLSGRTNVRMQLAPNLDATVTLGIIRNTIRLPQNDNNALGAISGGLLGKALDCNVATYKQYPLYCGSDSTGRGYFNANVPSTVFFAVNDQQQNDRVTGSIQANWTPKSWLRGTGQAGMDVLNRMDSELVPPNEVPFSATLLEGSRFVNRIRIPTYNLTGSLTSGYDLPVYHDLRAQTTVGAQYIREDDRRSSAQGAILLPGTSSLNGTSARFAVGESNSEVITIGGYLQQQLTFADRLFLTVGGRTDRNSSFGTQFTWVFYPSANLSWVVSDEDFFPKTNYLDQLRLRGGWGKSGQRPNFRQAATFFSPVSVLTNAGAQAPAITVGGTGNALLKPEVTTELEGGFESSWFRNRLSLEFTGYTKSTVDAIVSERLAPSIGLTATRLKNLGEVQNRGIEGLATIKILEMDNVDLATTITASTNHNKLISGQKVNGIAVPIFAGFNSTQILREGFPLGAYWERSIVSYNDYDGNGIISRLNCPTYEGTANPALASGPRCEVVLSDSMEYQGTPFPTKEATFNTGITLFKNVRISTLFDYRGGYTLFNFTRYFRQTLGVPNQQDMYDKTVGLERQARTMAAAMGDEVGFMEDASFTKWRELAITLSAPTEWAQRIRASGLSLTLAGRNLMTWTNYTGLDPEVNAVSASNFNTADFLTQPPVRYLVTRLNVTF